MNIGRDKRHPCYICDKCGEEIIGVIIFIKILISGIKQKKANKYWDWWDEGAGHSVALIVLGTLLIVVTPITIGCLLQNIFLPEITILDYIKGLM